MKTFSYYIFPPFVDAYECNHGEEGAKPLETVKEMIKDHAYEWGEMSVARSVLYGLPLPKFENKIVICCAYVGDKHFLTLVTPGDEWINNIEVIEVVEGIILPEWDIT